MSDFSSRVDRLASSDPDLGGIVRAHGRPAPFSRPPTFQTLVLLILEQQVSLDSARSTFDLLSGTVGVTPDRLSVATDEELRAAGLSRQKARYVRELARRVEREDLVIEALSPMSDDEVRRVLSESPGIGPWTADVYLMSALGRPDVWPVGDRALQVAVGESLGLDETLAAGRLEEIGERWRPHRSVAAQILWHGYLARRGRRPPGGDTLESG